MAASVAGDPVETARALAQQHKLIRGGEYLCWGCGSLCSFHVSLHCESCLVEHRRARTDAMRIERRMGDEEYRWRGMCRNMATDSRLTPDLAWVLLTNARKLPSADKFVDLLEQTYRSRFGGDEKKRRRNDDGFEVSNDY